jgi:tetratricopeptide (TPR) repeat protein
VKCYCSPLTQLRRLSCRLAVAGLFVALLNRAEPTRAQSLPLQDRFQQWLEATETHKPGDPGRAAVEVSTWTGPELEAVVAEAKQHARTLARSQPDKSNRLLLRGAALHADIGRLIPEDTVRRSPSQKTSYVIRDGRWVGIRYISMHWQLGRSLLDSVIPDPGSNPDVRAWYLETSSDLLRMRQMAAAVEHYARARQLFPSDPAILFGSGVLHERFASSAMQAGAESVVESNRTAAAMSSGRAELMKAERFLRDALAQQPDHLEARVRRGRVLEDLGRHREAIEELRRAVAGGATGSLLYLAQMFIGRAEEASGHDAAARAAFEHASAMYPNAQSPRLALSQIARRAGDRRAAQHELQAIARLPDDERRREDPWWFYYD